MKIFKSKMVQGGIVSMIFTCVPAIVLAQDSSSAASTSTDVNEVALITDQSSMKTWVYILGGILALGIIVAMSLRKKKVITPLVTRDKGAASKI